MSDETPFETPDVTDEDIRWATELLRLPLHAFYGRDGIDPRQDVLKSRESIDVAACPGSGKTTLLVAKLAILAAKWHHRTQGICVLSHTNEARRQIQARLGNTVVGRRLLTYPHFIGTIHGFVNEFLAVPWLRSNGYEIKMIDAEVCLRRRWNALSFETRSALEKNRHGASVLSVRSADFGLGEVRWGKGALGKGTKSYREMQTVCQESCANGYFCYDEMFVWAHHMIDSLPGVGEIIRDRFPLLFIDEAQDNSEAQSVILHRVFTDNEEVVLRQRFGDANQAIYDFTKAESANTDAFPHHRLKKELPNSHRFGPALAQFVAPFGLAAYDSGLRGQGPKEPLESGANSALLSS